MMLTTKLRKGMTVKVGRTAFRVDGAERQAGPIGVLVRLTATTGRRVGKSSAAPIADLLTVDGKAVQL